MVGTSDVVIHGDHRAKGDGSSWCQRKSESHNRGEVRHLVLTHLREELLIFAPFRRVDEFIPNLLDSHRIVLIDNLSERGPLLTVLSVPERNFRQPP